MLAGIVTVVSLIAFLAGGLMVLAGMLLMAWNVWKTWRMANPEHVNPVLAPVAAHDAGAQP